MAALPYMQLYVADYLADTAHLSTEEHGAYLLLLFNYWQTGKPVRHERAAHAVRLTNERWAVVKESLREYFHEDGEFWVHYRVESDLLAVNSKSVSASNAGKASAKARALAKEALKQQAAGKRSTTVEKTLNHTDTDTDTDTNTEDIESKTPVVVPPTSTEKKPKFDPATMKPSNVSTEVWNDWIQARKQIKKPLTESQCRSQAKDLAGHCNPDQVVKNSISSGWQGLFPDKVTNAASRHNGFSTTDYLAGVELDEFGQATI